MRSTATPTHEKSVFDALATARSESLAATTPAEASVAENHVQQALKSIFAVAEAFPQLQASPSFLQLQGDLVDAQDKIQASRRFYNGGVREFNTKIQVFPNNLFARRPAFGGSGSSSRPPTSPRSRSRRACSSEPPFAVVSRLAALAPRPAGGAGPGGLEARCARTSTSGRGARRAVSRRRRRGRAPR